jgi:hypothetical protein
MGYVGLNVKSFFEASCDAVRFYCKELDNERELYQRIKDGSYKEHYNEEYLKGLKVEEIKKAGLPHINFFKK